MPDLTALQWRDIGLLVAGVLFLLWTFVLAEKAGAHMRKRAERKRSHTESTPLNGTGSL